MPTTESIDSHNRESGWRRLLAIWSLPGIFAAPLAMLHQSVGGRDDGIHVFVPDRAFLIWGLAAPLEAAAGAVLATCAAVRLVGLIRSRTAVGTARDTPLVSKTAALFPSLLPTMLTMLRLFAPIWIAAVAGGTLMAAFLPVAPLSAPPRPNLVAILAGAPVSIATIGDLALVILRSAGLGLYGALIVAGIPLLFLSRLRSSQTLPTAVFVVWLLAGAASGWWFLGPLLSNTLGVWDCYVGGLGESIFGRAIYFALGSGAAAYLTCSLFSRRLQRSGRARG